MTKNSVSINGTCRSVNMLHTFKEILAKHYFFTLKHKMLPSGNFEFDFIIGSAGFSFEDCCNIQLACQMVLERDSVFEEDCHNINIDIISSLIIKQR